MTRAGRLSVSSANCDSACHTVPHSSTQCHTVPDSARQCHTLPHIATQCYIVPNSVTQCHTVPHSATQCHTVSHRATQCHRGPHSVILLLYTATLQAARYLTANTAQLQSTTQPQRNTQIHSTTPHRGVAWPHNWTDRHCSDALQYNVSHTTTGTLIT